MQATALVNEVYLKLVDAGRLNLRDRAHFFAIAATLMRQIVIDAARSRGPGEAWRRLAAHRARGFRNPVVGWRRESAGA